MRGSIVSVGFLIAAALAPSAHAGIGVFDPQSATFALRRSNDSGPPDRQFPFGPANSGLESIIGDWNGDGIDTIGAYDQDRGIFGLRNSNKAGEANAGVFFFGPAGAGWLPIAGDWNGDGIDTIGLYDPVAAVFHLRNSNDGGIADIVFFAANGGTNPKYQPIAGDWNGDGIDTVGTYRTSNRTFRIFNSFDAAQPDATFTFGPDTGGRNAVAGDFNGDGVDTVGIYGRPSGLFFLTNVNGNVAPDIIALFGAPGLQLTGVVGDFGSPRPPGTPEPPAPPAPGPPFTEGDPFSGGFLWKPRADNGGRLVVLLPSHLNRRAESVQLHEDAPPTDGTFIENGRFSGIGNGNRSHWRFSRQGGDYPNGVCVTVFTRDGEIIVYRIPDTGRRIE